MAELRRVDAVRLLVDRATAVTSTFALTEENAADVFACDARSGELRRAARVLGAALTMWAKFGASPANWAAFVGPVAEATELVRHGIGDEELAKEYAIGAALPADEAIAYALREDTRRPDAAPVHLLTRRETEVAKLIADGLTNRDIAARLVISVRTAETHVDHIRTKLGFSNRAQIAAWISQS
jgi:DNA-binding CsgD family transcriptional regulator